jgi:putative ABC transport system permease protein
MIPIAYNLRSLTVRKSTTFAAATGLGLVVFVFASALMLSNGIRKTLGRSAQSDVSVVLQEGADTELTSILTDAQVGLVVASKEVARGPSGLPDGIGELVVVALLEKIGGEGLANVQLRGVPDGALSFRPEVTIVDGRAPQPGTDEAMVGKAIRGRIKGIDLGQSFELRKNRPLKVVGVFSSEGSAFESEVWTDIQVLRAAFGREGMVSSARVRIASPEGFDAFKAAIERDPRLGLVVLREGAYYEKQGAGMSMLVNVTGLMTAILFSIGAMIGAMTTMHASVASRRREIGTLRALGFSKLSILSSFMLESVALSLFSGVFGALGALAMSLVRFSTMNFASWSEIVIAFEPTPGILVGSFVVAGLMGVLGGFFPALRAARMNPLEAMRE